MVLCADDYGLSPGVSRGIRELLANGRLSAASCMVFYPEFAEDGPRLEPYFNAVDIGLHFTLTADRPLASVLRDGWLRRLDSGAMRAELEWQVNLFMDVMGRPPAYIDGHQHVHLLPGVREAVAEVAQKIRAYVRLTREPIDAAMLRRPAPVDSAYLSWASRPLAQLTRQTGVRTNSGFRGVRNFRERAPFRDLFRQMIAAASSGTIMMCHPGHVDDMLARRDSLTQAREEEFSYFAGADFPGDLAGAGLVLARLGDALAEPLSTAVA
jgi:hypothetical protein